MTTIERILHDLETLSPEEGALPETDPDPGDTIVGVIKDEGLKRMYRLISIYAAKANEAYDRMQIAIQLGDRAALRVAASEHLVWIRLFNAAHNAFNLDVAELFDIKDKDHIGIRRGWKVTWTYPIEDRLLGPQQVTGGSRVYN